MKNYIDFINELKFYNKELNLKFWIDNKFNDRIRLKLLKIAKDFYNSIEIDLPIEDIELTGSLANYNYNEHSDLDVHVIVDFSKIDTDRKIIEKLFNNERMIWNLKHNITIQGHDVELYIQDINEKHVSSGLYSLLNDEWIKEPKYKDVEVDENDVLDKYEKMKTEIVFLENIVKQKLTKEELENYLEYINNLKIKIIKERKAGLATSKAEFSVENLAYKKLRNEGYVNKLFDIYNKIYDLIFIQ